MSPASPYICSAKFSKDAEEKMLSGCPGCPYTDFKYFYDYYGTADYAHQWTEAAFAGESTKFSNGNADFSRYGMDGRVEAIKKVRIVCSESRGLDGIMSHGLRSGFSCVDLVKRDAVFNP